MLVQHAFYAGHDNEQALELLEGNPRTNLSQEQYDAITRVTITLRPKDGGADVVMDSNVTPTLITFGGQDPGRKVLIEGRVLPAGVTPGVYHGRVTVYSGTQPQGLVWIDFHEYSVVVHD